MSPKTAKRDFSHFVEIAVPHGGLGKRLDAMHAFHAGRRIKACLGRGRREDSRYYLRWYLLVRLLREHLRSSLVVPAFGRRARKSIESSGVGRCCRMVCRSTQITTAITKGGWMATRRALAFASP